MNEYEKKIVSNVEKYGCHVTSVFDPDGEKPVFSYSTGITKTYNAPELIVIGLSAELGHFVITEYADRLKKSEIFEVGRYYSDFLDGFDVTFGEVSDTAKNEYMLSSCWFNKNKFEALQLIWPTIEGIWPWQEGVPENYRSQQPCLAGVKTW